MLQDIAHCLERSTGPQVLMGVSEFAHRVSVQLWEGIRVQGCLPQVARACILVKSECALFWGMQHVCSPLDQACPPSLNFQAGKPSSNFNCSLEGFVWKGIYMQCVFCRHDLASQSAFPPASCGEALITLTMAQETWLTHKNMIWEKMRVHSQLWNSVGHVTNSLASVSCLECREKERERTLPP